MRRLEWHWTSWSDPGATYCSHVILEGWPGEELHMDEAEKKSKSKSYIFVSPWSRGARESWELLATWVWPI